MRFFRAFTLYTLLLFLMGQGIGQAVADPAVVIKDVQLSATGSHTQITITSSERIPVNAFVLDAPRRVVLDLPEVTFSLPEQAGKMGKGLIGAYRFGHFAAGQSRMVFDLKSPAAIGEVKTISTVEGAPHKVVIDIVRVSQEKFIGQVKQRESKAEEPTTVPEKPADVAGKQSWPLVVLDPGHGGIDSGAHAAGSFQEKNFTFSFAKILKEELVKTNLVRVMMTRDKDVFVPLRGRREFAQKNKAALFISIHADSFGSRAASPSGATVYTRSEKATDKEAALYAERENKADETAGIAKAQDDTQVADILFDLMERETKSFSLSFSHLLTGELKDDIKLNRNPRRSADFVVLRAPDVPAILLEMGYLSNDRDVKQMQSEEWQRQAAKAVVKSVEAFLEQSQSTGSAAGQR